MIVAIENLLEVSNMMKVRHESDYLREHRGKLVLQSQPLQEIENGRTGHMGEFDRDPFPNSSVIAVGGSENLTGC